jgi:hypothetical protein
MRMSDIKKAQRIDEKLANWVGNFGASTLKQLGNRMTGDAEGHSTIADKFSKEKFVNDFLSRAYSALTAEIESGRVDPQAAGATAPAPTTPTTPPATPPPAPAAPTAPAKPGTAKVAPGNAGAPGAVQKQTNQNINNYVQGVARQLNAEPDRNKKIALTKELINFMADRKDYPEWGNALGTAKAVLQKNQAGGNMVRALQGGQKVSEAWNVYWINKLLESVNLSWKDVGLTLLKEDKKNGRYIIAESKYTKLNNIFESIMLSEAESISQFLQRWVPTYMRGTDMSDPNTQALIKGVEDTYQRDQGQAAMKKLATAAFAATRSGAPSGGGAPAPSSGPSDPSTSPGASGPQGASTSAGSNTASTPQSVDSLMSNVKSNLAKLKGMDPAMYAKFIKELTGAGSSAPAPAPAPIPVSETRKRR